MPAVEPDPSDSVESAPAGPADAIQKAIANAPDAAMQGLSRARERVHEMAQAAMQKMNQAMGQIGDLGGETADQVPGTLAPVAKDTLAHLPEVWL